MVEYWLCNPEMTVRICSSPQKKINMIDWNDPVFAQYKNHFDESVKQLFLKLSSEPTALTSDQLKEFAIEVMEEIYVALINKQLYIPIV